MKTAIHFLWVLVLASCNTVTSYNAGNSNTKPTDTSTLGNELSPHPLSLTKDFQTWYNYTYYNIRLAQDFTALDTDLSGMNKKDFLEKMATGNYVAFKIKMSSDIPVYRLYKLNSANEDIQNTCKAAARQEMENDAIEGKTLPDFHFTDINGNAYSKVNTKGKRVMIKCWFIHCTACVAEFPKLNQLADEYKQNKDVLFISLARDTKEELSLFLQTKPFHYKVVPLQADYMNALGINMFPTHLLIGKDGRIIKVTNNIDDMIPALRKEVKSM